MSNVSPAFIDLATMAGTPGNPTYYTDFHEEEPSSFGFDRVIRPGFRAPKSAQYIRTSSSIWTQCISGFSMVVLILIFLMYIKG
jgi:hypothetical protein